MIKPRGNTVAILDVGSSKVLCMVSKIKSDGYTETIGVGCKQADGIRSGQVTNAKQLVSCIIGAIDDAEKESGEQISGVYVVLSGFNLRSHYCSVETIVNGHEISDKDIKILVNKCRDLYSESSGLTVIHAVPLNYRLDDNEGIVDPRGMYGSVLSASYHIITASKASLNNLSHCVQRCHVAIMGYIDGAYASGIACIGPDEKKLGVAVINIGGGCTTISTFSNDNIVYSDVIPIGGMHITKDIASGLSTALVNAEKIKILYGSVLVTAIDRNEPVEVQCIVGSAAGCSEDDVTNITKETLVDIIRPRVEEILELVLEKLRSVNQRFLCMNRIVFTGGSSKLNGLKDLMRYMCPGARTRTGSGDLNIGSELADSADPSLSSAVGALMFVRDTFFNDGIAEEEKRSYIKRLVNWVQEKVNI